MFIRHSPQNMHGKTPQQTNFEHLNILNVHFIQNMLFMLVVIFTNSISNVIFPYIFRLYRFLPILYRFCGLILHHLNTKESVRVACVCFEGEGVSDNFCQV